MKTRQNYRNWRWWVLLGALVLAVGLLPNQAQAVTRWWFGGTGWWDTGSNWDPAGQPNDGDAAYIAADSPTIRSVLYWNTSYPEAELEALWVVGGYPSTPLQFIMFLDQSLITQYTGVGLWGPALFNQSAGSHVVHGSLEVGAFAGTGTYQLSGGSLQAANETIGYHGGVGTFIQSGGTNTTTGYIDVGYGVSGTYELHGGLLETGSLTIGREYYSFMESEGTFTQTGGTNRITSTLSVGSSSPGVYELHDGDLEAGALNIGSVDTGTFTQTGGGNTVFGDLKLGVSSDGIGTYNLSDGAMLVENEYVGDGGTGTFTQTGGVNHINTILYVGKEAGSSGTYELGGGILSAGSIRLGHHGTGNFRQTAGTVFLDSWLHLGVSGDGSGSYDLQGGNLWTTYTSIGEYGTGTFTQTGGRHSISSSLSVGEFNLGSYTLSGDGSLEADWESVGIFNTGTFTQTEGTNQITNILTLGVHAPGEGTYTLSDGSLSAWNIYVGAEGTGTFTQEDGNATLSGGLFLGYGLLSPGPSGPELGTYTLSGGHLEAANESVGYAGSGTFTQTGGFNKVGNTLALAVNPGSSGQYVLQDGYLETGSLDVNQGGTFHQDGGELVCGDLTNRNTVNLNGGVAKVSGTVTNEAAAQLNIANNGTFSGTTTNYGTVKVTGITVSTTVTWGTYVEHGTYISDPAKHIFNNLIVYPDGVIKAGQGDYFLIKEHFINMSEANQAWNTQAACLQFIKGETNQHILTLNGLDLGATTNGYLNNFAWGCLDITEQQLFLRDSKQSSGGALYVGELLGLEWEKDLITNIFGDGIIYYDPFLPRNEYLAGLTFNLDGGGSLRPVPLPASAWLFLSGLAGLGLLRRGKKLWKS
jgi:hypothetical protein